MVTQIGNVRVLIAEVTYSKENEKAHMEWLKKKKLKNVELTWERAAQATKKGIIIG